MPHACLSHVTSSVTCHHRALHVSSCMCVVAYHCASHVSDVTMWVKSGVSQVIVHVTCYHACHTIVSCCRAITMCLRVAPPGVTQFTSRVMCSYKSCVTAHITCRQCVSCTSQVTYRNASCLACKSSHITWQCIPSHTSHAITRI